MLTVKYVKDCGHPYMRECSVSPGLWTCSEALTHYREEGSRKGSRNVAYLAMLA